MHGCLQKMLINSNQSVHLESTDCRDNVPASVLPNRLKTINQACGRVAVRRPSKVQPTHKWWAPLALVAAAATQEFLIAAGFVEWSLRCL